MAGYMNTTTYTLGSATASVEAGSTWGKAYATLDPFGVTVAGGRASVVGVGGFITGGGYSFHSNRAGFGCDTVRNFEIVLANGTVVNANAKENADLWRAQKGGSGNFGFITRIDMGKLSESRVTGSGPSLTQHNNRRPAYQQAMGRIRWLPARGD